VAAAGAAAAAPTTAAPMMEAADHPQDSPLPHIHHHNLTFPHSPIPAFPFHYFSFFL
jgi:hypothetical protein